MRRVLFLLALLVFCMPAAAQAGSITFDWIVENYIYSDKPGDIGISKGDKLTITITYRIDNLYDPDRDTNIFWPTRISDASGILASLMDGYAEGEGSIGPSALGPESQYFIFRQTESALNYTWQGTADGLGSEYVGQIGWSRFGMSYQTDDIFVVLSGEIENIRDRLPVAGQTPEPATFALLGTALGAVWLRTRRRGSDGPA